MIITVFWDMTLYNVVVRYSTNVARESTVFFWRADDYDEGLATGQIAADIIFFQCHHMSLMDFVVSPLGCCRSVTDF
jgi:hypothetical protein